MKGLSYILKQIKHKSTPRDWWAHRVKKRGLGLDKGVFSGAALMAGVAGTAEIVSHIKDSGPPQQVTVQMYYRDDSLSMLKLSEVDS